ncbi:efflux transporter outer membrane subunit [Salinisphaera sp. USBA-960]|uniref:efflux transporter outer membrane subunit n=1 Tax=Salinisphaera orenii TaxID=856731 RepID=UPI0017C376C1|nr:efflux transporter outer membrane subunit [Salifodinibacter halophilus]
MCRLGKIRALWLPRRVSSAVILIAGCVTIASSVSGCASRSLSELSDPQFTMPARFEFSGDAPRAQHWWRAFDDAGLNKLIERALSDNFSLRAGYARVKRARAMVKAANANLFPTASGSVDQSATHRPDRSTQNTSSFTYDGSQSGSTASLTRDRDNWQTSRSAGVNINYNLDIWGKYRDRKKAATYDLRGQREALKAAAMTTAGDIASDWYKFQELSTRIRLLKRQLKVNKNILELTRFSFKNGQSSAADVLRQRQTVARSKGQIAKTRAQKQSMHNALAVLVGRPPEKFSLPPGQLVDLPPLPETGVPGTLVMRRPDVRRAFFQVAADNRRVAAALADRYPDVSLSASFNAAANPGSILSHWVTQLTGSISQTLFDAGAKAAQVEKNRATVDAAVADYQSKMLKALKQVETALSNEKKQKMFLQQLNRQLSLSKKTVANLRLRYLRGATDYFKVLDTVINRQDLQTNQITARFNLLQYRINLYRALAGGVPVSSIGHKPSASSDN